MPLYEYQCRSCSKISEVIQRMDDAPLSTCDECGGELKKLFSAPSFQFKGSGWYVTDYAKGGANGKASSGDGDSSEPKAKSDAKSDAGAKSDSGESAKSGSGESKPEKASAASPKPKGKTKSERIASD